jgi:oligopeptide/dipeptide ABC transporter ATP-binding protein
VEGVRRERLDSIPGQPPELKEPFHHCPFAPRCPYAMEQCERERPELFEVAPDHASACWRWEEVGSL